MNINLLITENNFAVTRGTSPAPSKPDASNKGAKFPLASDDKHSQVEIIEKPTTDLPEMDSGEDDEILEQAIEVIRQTKRASTSSLQRRLRIGYTRAARVMDLLEERGMIGPPDGAGPREILIDLDGEIPQNPGVVNDGTD